ERITNCAPFYTPVTKKLLHRHAFLPARFLHYEIQSESSASAGQFAGLLKGTSAHARRLFARIFALLIRFAGYFKSHHRHAWGVAHTDGRGSGGMGGCRDDSRVP